MRPPAPRPRYGGARMDGAVEEPLEIRAGGAAVAVTMRTPGDDEELALGFLIGEGLLDPDASPPALRADPPADLAANIVEVRAPLRARPATRRFYATSSCGVCGKGALEEVAVHAPRIEDATSYDGALLAALPDRLDQPGFRRTGAMHATGLFTAQGELLIEREDVGRHNALDKVVGAAALAGRLPLTGLVLVVTGRLAFELVQKSVIAGASALVGVGAPTSLAVELARDRNLTLCGFARGGATVEVYAGETRVRHVAR